jgi:LysM repeat protein
MNQTSTLITRLLAALALVAAVVAVFVVVSSNTGSDESPAGKNERAAKTGKKSKKPKRAAYEVQGGDTLTGIAQKTGVSVDRIEALNPELDPQALQAGQKLKLR